MKLYRVPYGKKSTHKSEREYQFYPAGPVGCLCDFELKFPGVNFEIIDNINGDEE